VTTAYTVHVFLVERKRESGRGEVRAEPEFAQIAEWRDSSMQATTIRREARPRQPPRGEFEPGTRLPAPIPACKTGCEGARFQSRGLCEQHTLRRVRPDQNGEAAGFVFDGDEDPQQVEAPGEPADASQAWAGRSSSAFLVRGSIALPDFEVVAWHQGEFLKDRRARVPLVRL